MISRGRDGRMYPRQVAAGRFWTWWWRASSAPATHLYKMLLTRAFGWSTRVVFANGGGRARGPCSAERPGRRRRVVSRGDARRWR